MSVRARLLEAGTEGAELDRERGCPPASSWEPSDPDGGAARLVATRRNNCIGGEIPPLVRFLVAMEPALSPAFMSVMAALISGESLGLPDLLPERLLVPVAPRLL